MHAGAVKLGSVDVGNEGLFEFLFSENASLVSEPIVRMDNIGLKIAHMAHDEFLVSFLYIANRNVRIIAGGNDFVVEFKIFVGAAVAMNRVEIGGGVYMHEARFDIFCGVRNYEVNVGTFARQRARHVKTSHAKTPTVVGWKFPTKHEYFHLFYFSTFCGKMVV